MAWMMRGLSRSLCRVVRSMREIADGRGDLTRRLPATGRDGPAELARAFNAFVEIIQGLMRQVVGATTQLASAADYVSQVTRSSLQGVERQQQETDQVVTAVTEMSAAIQEPRISDQWKMRWRRTGTHAAARMGDVRSVTSRSAAEA